MNGKLKANFLTLLISFENRKLANNLDFSKRDERSIIPIVLPSPTTQPNLTFFLVNLRVEYAATDFKNDIECLFYVL